MLNIQLLKILMAVEPKLRAKIAQKDLCYEYKSHAQILKSI